MLLLLSPAKSLDFDTPAHVKPSGPPPFVAESAELIAILKQKTPAEIAELMDLSDDLAALNVGRYGIWSPRFTARNSKPAALAFDGDVYGGLDAKTLSEDDLAWADEHVAILSGLYGVLRPLSKLQAYRLEMGTALANPRGQDLYAYWGNTIAEHLNQRLARLREKEPLVVNLASQEYFKAVRRKVLKARVVECVFEDWKGGGWKVISFFAKRARGLMARHAILNRAHTVGALESFAAEGYAFDADASEPDRMVFRRLQPPAAAAA
jgi:uncharacterized protein